jgi:hypothetical protein
MLKARLIIIVAAIVIIASYEWFILHPVLKGYIYFTEFAADLINKRHRLEAIRNTITSEKFLAIQKIVIAVGVFLCLFFAFAIRYAKTMAGFLQRISSRLKLSWASNIFQLKSTSLSSKIIFTTAIIYLLVQSIWYITHLPFIHDEAYTISNFILPGPLASITFYPYPNNHIFFSLFSYPFTFLPFAPEVVFRLPSLVAMVLTCFIFFRLLLLQLSSFEAALGVLIFVMLLPVSAYAVLARGYCLVFLFTALCVFCVIRIAQNNSAYHKVLLVLFSVSGFYTLPSFLYPFVALMGVHILHGLHNKNKLIIYNAVVINIAVAIFTLLLYSPVILTSGGWSNFLHILYLGYDVTAKFSQFYEFVAGAYSIHFFEQTILVPYVFILLGILFIFSVRNMLLQKVTATEKIFFWICVFGLLAPIISFIVQRKMIAPRTHSYVSFFLVGYIFVSLKIILPQHIRLYFLPSLAFVLIFMNFMFVPQSGLLNGEQKISESANLFAEKMLSEKPESDTCYSFDIYYLANINLKYALSKREMIIYQNDKGNAHADFDYKKNFPWVITNSISPVNLDSMKTKYATVVVRDDATLWRLKN